MERYHRTNHEIAEISAHSLSESIIPARLKRGENVNVAVDFHLHDSQGNINSFGIYYVPVKRDEFDLASGRICPVTIIALDEKLSKIQEKIGFN